MSKTKIEMKRKFEINIEEYVAIGFYEYDIKADGKVDFKSEKKIKIIDIPRWLYQTEMTKNRIDWILCRYKFLANRKKYYNTAYQYYDKKTGIDLDVKSAYSRVQSCKATLTKWDNKFEKWKRDFQPTLLIQSYEDDPDYPIFLNKYKAKEYALRIAEQDLAKEIEKNSEQYDFCLEADKDTINDLLKSDIQNLDEYNKKKKQIIFLAKAKAKQQDA